FMRSNSPSPARSSDPSTCSAGNLFGTTRTSQPGEFGAPPFCRYDSTSGGVSDSWPGQNGHCSRPRTMVRSTRKSLGRFWRSVEMITQRPVTGSLRSSGIEGVLEQLHGGGRVLAPAVDGHDIEAARTVDETMRGEIRLRELDDALPLARGDGGGRI